jgi:hypothetical protein
MSTAPAAVRAAARYISPAVSEEGVAQLIEQLVLVPPEVAARNADRLAAAHDGAARIGRAGAAGAGGDDDASDAANDDADGQSGLLDRVPASIGASHA